MFKFEKLWRASGPKSPSAYGFERPLVLLESDDWGRVGVRDEEGYEQIRAQGIRLGEHPYDFYTLETANDVNAVHHLLKRHKDSTGRSACLGMNFVMANLDFEKIHSSKSQRMHLRPLAQGLPGKWKRDGLFDAYREGIKGGIFLPCLHGLTHFSQIAIEHALTRKDERSRLLEVLWKAETPYIYWRMPWVGYEYYNPEKPHSGFLSRETQTRLIQDAGRMFKEMFGRAPGSACAPGYRGNIDTQAAWSANGIRVIQNGSGSPLPPQMDEFDSLNIHRTIDFEPSQKDLPVEKYLQLAEGCFARGVPAIISVHSINFHSTLKDFITPTLRVLDEFLTILESKYPNLLYLHDMDLYDIVCRGKFHSAAGMVSVRAIRRE